MNENDLSSDHFRAVRRWAREAQFKDENALALLQLYREQHESPFHDSNRVFSVALIAALLFFLRFYGIELRLKVFEVELISIPNPLFFMALISLIALSYAAVRAADAAYYQTLSKLLSYETLNDTEGVFARGFFGGGSLSGNYIDVWRHIGERSFRWWFVALFASFGVGLTAISCLPYVAGFVFLFAVQPAGTAQSVLVQQAFVLVGLIVAIIAGLYAVAANELTGKAFRQGVTPPVHAIPDAKPETADAGGNFHSPAIAPAGPHEPASSPPPHR